MINLLKINLAQDLLHFPKPGSGTVAVWHRNFLYFKHTLLIAMSWIFIEPILYLFALGFGLGQFVPSIEGVTYAEFIAPAMMAISGMYVGFFEGTYSTFTKMTRQNTYQTIVLAPVSSDEIVLGEILWISTKAFFSITSVALVLVLMGLIQTQYLLGVIAVLVLMSWVFAAMGVWLASIAKSYEWFSYLQSAFITPMSLFCGTYFPLSQMPDGLIYLSYALPLTHGLMAGRTLLSGEIGSSLMLNLLYLFFAALFFTSLAAAKFKKKLIV